MRQQDLEAKKKWLTEKGFRTFTGGKANTLEGSLKFKDLYYVAADPSQPPHLFKFRSDEKETFLHGQFKAN